MINITPRTDDDTEVNPGDKVTLKFSVDAQILDHTELTLTIRPDGSAAITKTGSDLSETDNGDGTYTYSYDYTLESTRTTGDWQLDSDTHSDAADAWVIYAKSLS